MKPTDEELLRNFYAGDNLAVGALVEPHMNSDRKPTLEEVLPLPEGLKLHRYKFGKKPASPVATARTEANAADPATSPEFEIRWEDAEQGLMVVVRPAPTDRLLAEVSSKDAGHLDKAALSVGLVGRVNDQSVHKLIPFKVAEQNGCSGSADFGPLADAVNQLGPQLGLIVFLLV